MVLKFDDMVTANGFKENIVNQCVYMKVCRRFLVLYVDDILITSNGIDLLVETKQILFSHFLYKGSWGSILCLRHTDTSR